MKKKTEDVSTIDKANLSRTYAIGQSAGLNDAAKILLDRAILHFRAGSDSQAVLLRHMSDELRVLAEKCHPDMHKVEKS